jgi:hypothetical protein
VSIATCGEIIIIFSILLTTDRSACIVHNDTYYCRGAAMKEDITRWDGENPAPKPREKDPERGVW